VAGALNAKKESKILRDPAQGRGRKLVCSGQDNRFAGKKEGPSKKGSRRTKIFMEKSPRTRGCLDRTLTETRKALKRIYHFGSECTLPKGRSEKKGGNHFQKGGQKAKGGEFSGPGQRTRAQKLKRKVWKRGNRACQKNRPLGDTTRRHFAVHSTETASLEKGEESQKKKADMATKGKGGSPAWRVIKPTERLFQKKFAN